MKTFKILLGCVAAALLAVAVIALSVIKQGGADDLTTLKRDPLASYTPPHATVANEESLDQTKDNNALFKDGNSESTLTRTLRYTGVDEKDVSGAIAAQAKRDGWSLVTDAQFYNSSGLLALFSKKQAGQMYGLYVNRDALHANTIIEVFTIY